MGGSEQAQRKQLLKLLRARDAPKQFALIAFTKSLIKCKDAGELHTNAVKLFSDLNELAHHGSVHIEVVKDVLSSNLLDE